MRPFQATVDQVAMAMKGCSVSPKAPALLGPHHQTLVSYPGHSWGGLTPLQRCSECILQPQPTGHRKSLVKEKFWAQQSVKVMLLEHDKTHHD